MPPINLIRFHIGPLHEEYICNASPPFCKPVAIRDPETLSHLSKMSAAQRSALADSILAASKSMTIEEKRELVEKLGEVVEVNARFDERKKQK